MIREHGDDARAVAKSRANAFWDKANDQAAAVWISPPPAGGAARVPAARAASTPRYQLRLACFGVYFGRQGR